MNRISRLFVVLLGLTCVSAIAADAERCMRNRAWADEQRHLDEVQISDMVAEGKPVPAPLSLHATLRSLVAASERLRRGPAVHLIGFVDREPNAYATDHGLVILTSALWDSRLGLDDNELAAVLAHELAHIEARDGLGEVCALMSALEQAPDGVEQMRALLARESFNPSSPLARSAALTLQHQELEADERAIALLCLTGRPPQAMATALAKLHAPGSYSALIPLADTHPDLAERLDRARTLAQTSASCQSARR
ncbi:MAG: M48 family metalloprotease [Hydrogenophaga sp.]|uniref:M48 family metalloprotease n=1 Tax=Hydrogenophaga sp. TaxID=1904254 RepID=UPI001D49B7D0|nr:M48 family metalloprotease [Hydrogenophaga sp.]MBX3608292.1 M48 family metalloprotease [Hydrogenophaga sp.]